jgi:hypothetical protein
MAASALKQSVSRLDGMRHRRVPEGYSRFASSVDL